MEKRSPAVPEPMEMLAGHITDYLHYLKHDCGLRVSIHEFQRIAAPFLAQFLPYRIHDNPCCLYLKSHPDIWTACIRNQKRLSGYLEQGPFFGCCHCGIGEYVYPIRDTLSDTVIGFISVSGYFLPEHHVLDRLTHTCQTYGLSLDTVRPLFEQHLSDSIPDAHKLDTLLFPLAFMLEQLYRQECLGFSNTTGRLKKQNQLLGRILLFIEENLNRSFTIEELCSAFHCSRSYISHLFCSATGHSFPEYLNLLRMEEARKLLAQTDFPITEIALKTGFSSSSYFSSLFRRMNGMSPSTYRNLRTLSPKEK